MKDVQDLNLGTVWNEWNNNWTSVELLVLNKQISTDRRGQWPFIRRVDRTTVDNSERLIIEQEQVLEQL